MTDWKCDICGRKEDGTDQPPQGWLLLVIQDRYTNLDEERVLCNFCLDSIRQADREPKTKPE